MPTTSEAHILVTLPNAKLTSSPSGTLAGRLALEYVTFDIPRSAGATTTAIRDVMLILRLGDGTFEEPLDPARTLTTSVLPSGARRYVFHATRDDPEFALEIPLTPETADDVELFHSVLAGYATDFRGGDVAVAAHRGALPAPRAYQNASGSEGVVPKEDLRGRFAFMNEESGEIVGALDGSVRVHEDASLGEKGHEADPVVVELPEGADTLDDVEVLVRTVPPEDRDWMVRGAVFASHAISGTATLLASAMTSASNYYISHSTPSPHATDGTAPSTSTSNPSSSSSPSPGSGSNTPLPSRTLLLLQSQTTRKHLTRVHAVSGGAVKLSNKAAAAVDRLIRHVGTDNGKGRASTPSSSSVIPTRPVPLESLSVSSSLDKPPLSQRGHSKSPSGSRAPSRTPPPPQPQSESQLPSPAAAAAAPSRPPVNTRGQAVLSAAIILASLSASAVRVMDAGGAAVTAAVSHKYGSTAGENAALVTGTMRNVVLVYVDAQGFTRKAVVKRMAKSWVKGRVGLGPKK